MNRPGSSGSRRCSRRRRRRASARGRSPASGRETRPLFARIDAVFDDRQDRPLVVLEPLHEGRRAPVHRRREILTPRPSRASSARSSTMPRAAPAAAANSAKGSPLRLATSPQSGAAQRHRAEIGGEEDRQPPAPHPVRQRDLGRDEHRGHHDDPRRAGDEARDHRDFRAARDGEKRQREDRADAFRAPPRPIRPEPGLQGLERQRSDDRAEAEQRPSGDRTAPPRRAAVAGDQRHQRPIGAGEGKEGDAPGSASRRGRDCSARSAGRCSSR